MSDHDLLEQLESMVDKTSLERVLFALSAVCNEKADHLRDNWQDVNSAIPWRRLGAKIACCEVMARDRHI